MGFDVSFWRREVDGRLNGELSSFLKPVLEFISDVIHRGESVLVHCLAGAHRAGTTGIICLMHFRGMNSTTAISLAQTKRPIIDPIGDFRQLLSNCDQLQRDSSKKFAL